MHFLLKQDVWGRDITCGAIAQKHKPIGDNFYLTGVGGRDFKNLKVFIG